jgi:hypothetical protein
MRGALRLLGKPVPHRPGEVARDFCAAAGLDGSALAEVDALRHGQRTDSLATLFGRYYQVLERAADYIDRHVVTPVATHQQGAAS